MPDWIVFVFLSLYYRYKLIIGDNKCQSPPAANVEGHDRFSSFPAVTKVTLNGSPLILCNANAAL